MQVVQQVHHRELPKESVWITQLILPTPPNIEHPWDKKLRKNYVTDVMKEVLKLKERPTKDELTIVAQDIVARNCQQLPDKWFEGSAVSAMLTCLLDKRDNLCRDPQLQQMKRSLADDSEEPTSKRKPKKSHGCAKWQPRTAAEDHVAHQEFLKELVSQPPAEWNVEEVQERMKLSFPLQRLRLNALKPVSTLSEDWPILLTKYGITTHFELMQGFDPIHSVRSNCEEKIPSLVQHLSQCPAAKKASFDPMSLEEGDAKIPGGILLAMAFFQEEPSHLFVLQEVRVGLLDKVQHLIFFYFLLIHFQCF